MPENDQFSVFPPEFYFCQGEKAAETVYLQHPNCPLTKLFEG